MSYTCISASQKASRHYSNFSINPNFYVKIQRGINIDSPRKFLWTHTIVLNSHYPYIFLRTLAYHIILLTTLRYPIDSSQDAPYIIKFSGINQRNNNTYFTLSYQLTDYHGPYCRLIFIRLHRSDKCNCFPLM